MENHPDARPDKRVIFDITCDNNAIQVIVERYTHWLNRIQQNLEWKTYMERTSKGFLWIIEDMEEFAFIGTQTPNVLNQLVTEERSMEEDEIYQQIRQTFPEDGIIFNVRCVNHPAHLFMAAYTQVFAELDPGISVQEGAGNSFNVVFHTVDEYMVYVRFLWRTFDAIYPDERA